jgi:hypothetical protein
MKKPALMHYNDGREKIYESYKSACIWNVSPAAGLVFIGEISDGISSVKGNQGD